MSIVLIDNWRVVRTSSNPYLATELHTPKLKGEVYGHPDFGDGATVTTSRIEKVEGNVVNTYSRKYLLVFPNPEYVQWCKDNGHHVPTLDEPLKEQV